jgi:hypothetical protein
MGTVAAKRAHAQTDEGVPSTAIPIRQVLDTVDVDDDLLPIADVDALSTPVIPSATPKKERPTVLEWLSVPQERPRHRNLGDWLNDDTEHQPGSVPVVDVAAGPRTLVA